MAFELLSYRDAAGLSEAVAVMWLSKLNARKNPGGVSTVALSGGRIARTFFEQMAWRVKNLPDASARDVLLSNVHFFWADERCVPPTDPESNYGIARELLFEPLKVPEGQIHRLRGEENEALALRDAVENIQKWARSDKGFSFTFSSSIEGVENIQKWPPQPVLDLIFLGMGEDGHVASLFPGEPAGVMTDPAIYRAVTAVKPPPRRITLGYGALAAATEVWVLASGKGKEQALGESMSPDGKTPLARVLRSRANAETKIFTDIAPA
jgi:6-phosphogluconolactonase